MNKSLLIAVFVLLVSLQAPQVSYSQESNSKVCMGDCMVIWSEEKDYGDGGSMFPKETNPIRDVFFEADQYNLDETDRDILKTNAKYLMIYKDAHLEIQGHCDERGGNNENIALGEKRAASVKTYLVSLGIDYRRLHVLSLGEEMPFCMQSNEECWKSNNRVHFLISK
jgi:outer membrane protein OmpA-like peptidoglycan-associated protein